MRIKNIFSLSVFMLVWLFTSPAYTQKNPLLGVWLTDVKSHITIKQCGDAFCGHISKVSIRPKLYQKNKQAIDKIGVENAPDYFNKDPNLRSRRLLGLNVLIVDKKQSDLIYLGEVYNPEDGKTYKGKVELLNKNQLRLSGCILMGLLCQSEIWHRIK